MEILIGQFIKHPLKIKPINEYKSNLLGKHKQKTILYILDNKRDVQEPH